VRNHSSFAEQSLHYFVRPHDRVRTEPITDPAAWTARTLEHESSWSFELASEQVDELGRAAARAQAAGSPMEVLTPEQFPIPGLVDSIATSRRQLQTGLGVVRLRGLPVEAWGDDLSSWAYWGLGHHLGTPGAQNPAGEILGHVTDYGEEGSQPNVRRYRTAGNIDMHCDAADVVGLLCLRPAAEGGQSRIASSVTIFNELARRRPDLVTRLFEPFAVDRRDEQGPGEPPMFFIPPATYDGSLRTFWHSEYFRSAPRHDEVPDFTARELDLLDTFDAIAAEPGVHFDMTLEPGDLQLISNHTVVHARTAYIDNPASPRHLLRLWLSLT